MRKPTFGERLRYAFDNTLSRGTGALIGWLGLASIALIFAIALVVRVTRAAPDLTFVQLVWMGLMRTLDAGTMGGDSGGWGFLVAMLAVTLGGIFVISTLIGILTTGLESRLEELRKGRSRVIEQGHTVILGRSPQVFTIISELVTANANQRRACIVVLGDRDKVEMEDALRQRVGDTGTTRVVCRRGTPIDVADLAIANLADARSIIVVAPEDGDPDAQVIKTLLAITNDPNRRQEPYHIVAELRDPRNQEVAALVGRDEVELVLVSDLIARIIAQTCRQSGLSTVYTELLDFNLNEFYFHQEPALAGKTFGEALFAYDGSAVVGLCRADGRAQLNPPMSTHIMGDDRLIVIAADDDTTHPSGLADLGIHHDAIVPYRLTPAGAERTLILGWNWRAPAIVRELDNYVAPGSELNLVADYPRGEMEVRHQCPDLVNQRWDYRQGDTTDRRVLDGLSVERYDHVIVLSYSDTLGVQEADARTLVTLLHLRDIGDCHGHPFSIVSEMLDIRNRNLAEVTRADDFIVSDRLVSLMLAQVSENKSVNAVFRDIFDPAGAEIYLKPVTDYVRPGIEINFYTIVEAARRRGEVAIGYRLAALGSDKLRSYGVTVNPNKSEIRSYAEDDRIIVLAES